MAWLSRWSAVLSVALAFGVVYAIDRCTSNELSLFPLYLIPIGLALFNLGPVAGYGASALASLLWLNEELLSPSRAYSQAWIPLQAMAATWLVFLLITSLLCLYTSSNRTARHRLKRLNNLQRVLPICHDCGSILCHDGQWRSLEQVIQNPSSIGSLPAHHCVHAPENPSRHPDGQSDRRRPD